MTDIRYAVKNERIVDALLAKQTAEGLDDTGFAAKLGISTSMWTLIKTYKREIGGKPLRGIGRNYPDIWAMFPEIFRTEFTLELAPEKDHSVPPESDRCA